MKTYENNPSLEMPTAEWERYQLLEIIDALDAQKCVLILGNYSFSKPSKESGTEEYFLPELLQREQKRWTQNAPEDYAPDFYTIAQSLINRGGGQRMFMELTDIKWEDLGEKQKERFRKISEIPFDLIISTYPYDLLDQVFTNNQIDHEFSYYSYVEKPAYLAEPSRGKPLIYNLFGSVKHKESMIISLDRLYQFIFGVAGVRGLPKLIEDKIAQATHLVFMGFDFDAWYLKLLMRILKVHEKDHSYAHPHKPDELGLNSRLFFKSNFQMTFLEKQVDGFVDSLYELCQKESKLRAKNLESGPSLYEKLQKMITQYQLEEAMVLLDEALLQDANEGDLLKKLSDYRRIYHKIEEWENYDTLSKQELESKRRELRENLLIFIKEVDGKITL